MIELLKSIIKYLNEKGFFDLLVAKFFIQFLGFGTILLVAKFLSPTEIGEIRIIQSYAEIFIILAGFGFNTAVLKICSERYSNEEKESVLKISLKRSLITSLTTFIIILLLSYSGIITSSYHLTKWFIIYTTTIPINVFSNILMIYLQAKKKFKIMARIQTIIKIQSTIIIIYCTWKWGFKGFIFSTIASIGFGLIPLFWQVGIKFLKAENKFLPKNIMNYAVYSMFANLISIIGQRGDIIILDHFLKDRDNIGFYSIATIFLAAAMQVNIVVQQIITPYFSENADNKKWIIKQLKINIIRMQILSIFIAFSIFIVAWIIFYLFFDIQYMVILKYLKILLIKYIIFSSYALIGASLVGLGFMKYNFIAVSISTPVALVLLYFGLVKFGIVGIAWSNVIASIFTAILAFSFLKLILFKYYR